MGKKLVLIDGNSIAYRAFFALPLLNNDKGVYTNSVYGFTMMLNRIIEEEQPTHILVAFDAGKTTFRHATYGEYKGGRQKTPNELSEQFPFIRELLDCFQIKRYELENYEADDIIGTLSLQAEQEGFEVKVISGDKDLTQLTSDKTTVSITKKGITEMESYTPQHVQEKYGLSPLQIIDLKGLMGDASDNIPGIPGVGEKTALKLLHQFETVEHLVESIEDVSGQKLKEKISEHKELALLSKSLATIMREAPIEVKLDETEYNGINIEKVVAFYKELGFQTLLDKMNESTTEEAAQEPIDVQIIQNPTDELFSNENGLYVEILEDNYHHADIIGISLSNEYGHFYFPGESALQSDAFKKWAEDESKHKTVYDAKRMIVALRHRNIDLKGIDFDVFLASYILNPSESVADVSAIVQVQELAPLISDEGFYGKGGKAENPGSGGIK